MKSIKILDCTLRDGGYYNNWVFNEDLVNSYLNAMKVNEVDFVEIGLRSFNKAGFKGPYAFSTDTFLDSLNIPKNLNIGVMVNASEFNKFESKFLKEKICSLFKPASDSRISLVRIASHLEEFDRSLELCEIFRELGYIVGINIMQISEASNEQIIEFGKQALKSKPDVLYFADSLGNLKPSNISDIIKLLKTHWDGEIGIHTHDNMGMAMSNSQEAFNKGATWIDSTVTGMGRGPGNLQTEYSLIEFKQSDKNTNYFSLLKLIDQYFEPLQIKYKWGKNPYYFLSGLNSIHPTFIQEAISDNRYDEVDILALIDHLKAVGGTKYSKNISIAQTNIYDENIGGTWEPKEALENRNIVIVGNGPSLKEHKLGIEQFIKETNSVVICLNVNNEMSPEYVNYQAACHPMRVIADVEKYASMNKPLIMPFGALPELVREKLHNCDVLDYGLTTNESSFVYNKNSSNIPLPLVFAYVLAVSNSGNASQIFLAGFDGYEEGDPRNEEMNFILSKYFENKNSCKLVSITQSKYDIKVESLYAIRA